MHDAENQMTDGAGRLLLLNIGTPSRLLSISDTGGDSEVVVADIGVAPDGISIDPINRHVYWTYMGSDHTGEDFNVNDGSINRMDYDGANPVVIVPEGGTFTPKQIQCDAANGLLYWCDREGMRVMRCRTDGADLTVLVQTGAGDADRQDRRNHCVGVAVDPQGGFIYWTQKGKPNGNEGRILRAPIDLPVGMDPARRTDIETLFAGLPEPIDLEWDDETGNLYWTDRGAPPAGNTLNRAPMRSGASMAQEVVLSGLQEGIGLAIDRVGRRAFVSDLGGFVRSISLTSPHLGEIIFSGHGPLTGLAHLRA